MKRNIAITIERYENGITWVWEDVNIEQEDKYVFKDEEILTEIGKEIWGDIESVMNGSATNKVIMDVTYWSGDEDE